MIRRLLASLVLASFASLLAAQSHLAASAKWRPASARGGEQVTLAIEVTVEPAWHTYGSKEPNSVPIAFTVAEPKGLRAHGPARIPPGVPKTKGDFTEWLLADTFALEQDFVVPAGTKPGALEVAAELAFMVCDESHCEPPEKQIVQASLTIEAGEARTERLPQALEPPKVPTATGAGPIPPGDPGQGLWKFLLLAVLGGLFTLAMPCTYPMVPITISFFTKQASQRGGRVLPLALAYGTGIVLMFVLIGVLIGEPITVFAQHWVTNLVIGVAFLLFAVSLLGLINLEPPQALTDLATRSTRGGGISGVFFMGFTFVVTSFTCTAPFVGLLLSVGATGGSLGRVALGMGVFGLTCAVPFVLLALMPGRLQNLPKSGEWMHVLKVFLGFVELAAALKFFSNAEYQHTLGWLPRELFLTLWCGVFLVAGLHLLGMIRLRDEGAGEIGPGRLLGGLATMLLALYCGYGALGNRLDLVMEAIAPPYHAPQTQSVGRARGGATEGHKIVENDYDKALLAANAEHKWLLVNFTGYT